MRAMELTALAEVELADPEGTTHRIGDSWADQAAVLVFLRHFG